MVLSAFAYLIKQVVGFKVVHGLSSLNLYKNQEESLLTSCLNPYLLSGECLSKAKPYRIKMKFRSASITAFRSHVIASHRTDLNDSRRITARLLSLPPGSIPSPPSLLWFARVTGYPKPNHRRTALGCPKAKTPQNSLVDLGSWREQQQDD